MYKPTSHEETMALIVASQNGDELAKETLILQNIALVKSIVKGFLGRGTEYDDLLQLGTIGLLKAINGFDVSFDVRFSTYAVPLISGEIKRFLRDDGLIKVSRSLKENATKIYRAQEQLKKTLNREPTLAELAKETGLSTEDITLSTEATKSTLSIDEPLNAESPDATLLNTLQTPDEQTPTIERIMLKQMLASLAPRERQIIMLRYFSDKTQSEIAAMIGVSQVQVSRILQRTLARLQEEMGEPSVS